MSNCANLPLICGPGSVVSWFMAWIVNVPHSFERCRARRSIAPDTMSVTVKHRLVTFGVLLSVLVTSGVHDVAARGVGTSCARVGATKVVGKKSFTCVRAGKKRVWKVVAGKGGRATATKAEMFEAPTAASANLDVCRLADRSVQRARYGSLHVGFPPLNYNFPPAGKFTVALVPVDFSDLLGEPNPVGRVQEQMNLFSEWWSMVSGGRVEFQWRVTTSWVRVPGSVNSIAQTRSDDGTSVARVLFPAVDPSVDFSGVRAVYFLLPRDQRVIGESSQGFWHSPFGQMGSGGYQTAEGRIFNFALAGNYFDSAFRNYWSYWAHETGHMFPLPDLYMQVGNWGMQQLDVPIGPFSGYDMMSSQDGPTRTLNGWLRFLQGWLGDDQVWCGDGQSANKVRMSLRPIDDGANGTKMAMIRLSETTLLAVESRRMTKFDCPSVTRNGVIVYLVDTTIGHGEGFLKLQVPSGRSLVAGNSCGGPSQLDAILSAGQSVAAEGWSVSVVSSGTFDTVEISFLAKL